MELSWLLDFFFFCIWHPRKLCIQKTISLLKGIEPVNTIQFNDTYEMYRVQICLCQCAVICVGGWRLSVPAPFISLERFEAFGLENVLFLEFWTLCFNLYLHACVCVFVPMCLHALLHMWLEQTPTLVALSVCPMQNFCECVPSSSQLKHRWSDSESARETPAKVRPPTHNILWTHTHTHAFDSWLVSEVHKKLQQNRGSLFLIMHHNVDNIIYHIIIFLWEN